MVRKLSTSLSQLSPELYPLHQRLITLRRSLASIAARPSLSKSQITSELNPILSELRQIDEKRNPSTGKFRLPLLPPSTPSSSKPIDPDSTPTSTPASLPRSDSEEEEKEKEEEEWFEPPKGQALLAGLLQDNFDISQDIKAREGEQEVARGPLQAIYDRLSEIKGQLERLVLTHRWTLRETVSLSESDCESDGAS